MLNLEQLSEYIEQNSSAEDEVLAGLNRETHLKAIYPRMLSGNIQGKFLEFISRMICPAYILEIGTYTGYSAICLARGLAKGGKLITIEINDELATFQEKYFKKAGVDHCIQRETGDALKLIPALQQQFDLVFIDAEKKDYIKYYELVIGKVRAGGFVLADNVLWDGKVLKTNEYTDKETKGIIEFNRHIQRDRRVENVIVSIRDGISLIRKL
jgi:predicted O-methyltransferase YrrM